MIRAITKNIYLRIFLLFLIIGVIDYQKSFFAFFQSDEWFYFSQFLPLTHSLSGFFTALKISIFSANEISGGGHLTPLYTIIWWLHNALFGVSYLPYIILSIFFHCFNAFLVFLFTKKFTKRFSIAFMSGIFFLLSFVHFQAVTWIMAYVPTVYSTCFVLLSMLFLTIALESVQRRRPLVLSTIFFVFALLTKETTVILFVVLPLLVFFKDKSYFRSYLRWYLPVTVCYLLFRIGIPLFQGGVITSQNASALSPILLLYRVITYPLRVMVELYIPQVIFLPFVEYITPLGYPTYGAEQAVRGSDFLTFTQSAGSDLIIFPLSVIFIALFIFLIFYLKQQKELRQVLLLAGVIIVTSALPLVLIALYAPWWGFVTFIDSRHLYIASIGAAMFFSTVMNVVYSTIKKRSTTIAFVFVTIFIILWSFTQYYLMQHQLRQEKLTGQQRQTVINTIISSVPTLAKTNVFLVTSNTGYYGFGPIPPFQTNLAQTLTIEYYMKKQLPESFIQDTSLEEKGIAGEGIINYGGKQFGYFVDEDTLFSQMLAKHMQPDVIHAYAWDGNTNTMSNITDVTRSEYTQLLNHLNQYNNWKKITWNSVNMSFRIPPDGTLIDEKADNPNIIKKAIIQTNELAYQIIVWKRTLHIGVYEDISYMNNADGEMIGNNSYLRTFPQIDGEEMTAKMPLYGPSMQYYLPTIFPDKIIQVDVIGKKSSLNGYDTTAEEIIAFMKNTQE